ncbi:hypothetical protein G6011_05458 [Alternaria panax]|uniref:FAD-binding PCMH-type domain-containing protein n=1 Tax=Alternaria panax TaxID=48097 RepID=A0AAD4I6R6_9PLEO|nr:hypothetical protein G6011_05458 [Alternaria panax]
MSCLSFALVAVALLGAACAQMKPGSKTLSSISPPASVCTVLTQSPVANRVTYPGQSVYNASLASYFDIKSRLTPTCIVQPTTAKEVSTIVKPLIATSLLKTCQFAVQSGGHTPIPGANNFEDGVTIDLLHMNGTSYNAKSKVVLADGRIVNANKKTNADLFTALKGGNSNFSIVTRYDMETFKNEDLWGGTVSWPASAVNQHFKSLVNFGLDPNRNPNAALILFQGHSTASPVDFVRAAFDYTKPVVRPAAYNEFLAVNNTISDSTKTQPMSATAADFGSDTTKRVQFRTLSFKINLATLQEIARLYNMVITELQAKASGQWRVSCLHQILATSYTANSTARDGNVLGLERYSENFIMYQTYLLWFKAKDDERFIGLGKMLTDGIQKFAAEKGTAVDYLYLNYADKDQDPLSAHGSDKVAFMKKVAKKYDPFGVY